jgi:methanogenic corrinoid protein MtbC1
MTDPTTDCDRFLEALRRGDRRAADGVVDHILDRGAGLRDLYLDVIQPAMREIGRLWQENELTVAEEHLATAITQSAMGRAFERVYRWHESRNPSLIAACVDEERHQVGLRMICDLLELEGWDPAYLGASVPVESLVAMVEKRRPDVVALSAATAPNLPRLRDAVGAIRKAPLTTQPLIMVGGRAVSGNPELASRLGADITAADAAGAVELLRDRFAHAAQ